MVYRRFFMWMVSFLVAASPLLAEEVTIKQNGRDLLAYLELAPGKKISDGIILMTHRGLGHGQLEIMTELQELLKDNGLNSIAITLSLNENKRRGLFDCNKTHTHKHTDAKKEIGLWLEWLESRNANNVTLFGHSRGGNQTAWYAATSAGKAIKKVILLAPDYWTHEKKKANYAMDLDSMLKKANHLIDAGKSDELMLNTDFLFCKKASVSAAAFADYYNDNPYDYTPGLISKINVPVLVIAGSEDNLVLNVPELYKPGLKASDRLEVIDGADHFFRDLYVDEIADLIVKFVK